jgi:hypothetical protein
MVAHRLPSAPSIRKAGPARVRVSASAFIPLCQLVELPEDAPTPWHGMRWTVVPRPAVRTALYSAALIVLATAIVGWW